MSNIKREDKFKKDQKKPGMGQGGQQGGGQLGKKDNLGKDEKKIDKSGW